MIERGMIFNSEMVRAILDGRKTQTRRPIKWKQTRFTEIGEREDGSNWPWSEDTENVCDYWHPCPFGAVGNRIWVRETFQGPLFDFDQMDAYCKDSTPFEKAQFCVYKADVKPAPEFFDADDNLHCCWRPSIHMPRWASRITLEITDVRVERLNAITESDAEAEGITDTGFGDLLVDGYRYLWKSIYGDDSWQVNPWVWVIEFKRIGGDDHATD